MKIDNLISLLEKVRDSKGNIEVIGSSFCGTNDGHVTFKFKELDGYDVDDLINGFNQLSLSMDISDYSKNEIKNGTEDMQKRGYTFYCSQFVKSGEAPRSGLSPCEWHTPW
jgi:hypothetical protein